jgi:hypothetical protein
MSKKSAAVGTGAIDFSPLVDMTSIAKKKVSHEVAAPIKVDHTR